MTKTTETGRRLLHLRESRNWTQAELESKSGVSRFDISRYEAGHRTPSVDNLRKLARALEVTVDALV